MGRGGQALVTTGDINPKKKNKPSKPPPSPRCLLVSATVHAQLKEPMTFYENELLAIIQALTTFGGKTTLAGHQALLRHYTEPLNA